MVFVLHLLNHLPRRFHRVEQVLLRIVFLICTLDVSETLQEIGSSLVVKILAICLT